MSQRRLSTPDNLAAMPRWHSYLAGLLDAMAAIGTIGIVAIMGLIVADVAGRNLFDHPVSGVAEISARSVVAIVFLMLPSAAMKGTLIRADFLTRIIRRNRPQLMRVVETSFALLAVAMFAIVAWAAWPDTADAWRSSEFFGVRGVWTLPTFPFRAVIVLGAAATALAFLSRAQRILICPREDTPQ